MLDDFLLLYDELNDNIDTFVDRKDDMRKPLKLMIEADTEFRAKLRALKDVADVHADRKRLRIRADEHSGNVGLVGEGPSRSAGGPGRRVQA